ncbi:MAG: hypothetical protein ACKPCP_14295, partial [Sphaerospermopsis kisseleviana]
PDLAKRFTSAKTALQALETPEKTDITNSTIAKPAGSQIRLIKNEEYLETTLPPEGLTLNNFLEIIVMILWNSVSSFFIVMILWNSVASLSIVGAFKVFISNPFDWRTIISAIFSASFLFTGLAWMDMILTGSFSECKISINQ